MSYLNKHQTQSTRSANKRAEQRDFELVQCRQLISDLEHQDLEEFCARFTENIRVEYKSTFDQNVKKKLPRVVSAFANAYGGVLIIGVKASNGVPEKPIEGIDFADPEPRLTLENVCRENIFPEVPVYSKLVQSSVAGKAFLVVEVSESPKAPHAIENSTQVYVRTGDSLNPTALANLELIERLLLRRREVLVRWSEFYSESLDLATALGIDRDSAFLELRIGPLYPTETILSRENAFAFLSNPQLQHSLGLLNKALRHPAGALLGRTDAGARYINIGQLGTLHYLEPLRQTVGNAYILSSAGAGNEQIPTYPLWWITAPLLRAVKVAAALMVSCAATCGLRVEAKLCNVSKLDFTLALDGSPWATLPVSTLSRTIPASLTHPSETLAKNVEDVVTELLYQLRWPFGTEAPDTRDEIRPIVAKAAASVKVHYQ
jgi:hypothetical protein